uniref:Uncharacterized protein n=1 Tax=Sus scrofa TaxID=9823 RepID=A0A4X1TEI1_PIG
MSRAPSRQLGRNTAVCTSTAGLCGAKAPHSRASIRRRASASSSCRGCTMIPTSATGGRRSRARTCCRSSCSRGSCERSADARHSTRSSRARGPADVRGCLGFWQSDPESSADSEPEVPAAAGAGAASHLQSRGSLVLLCSCVQRWDLAAGQSAHLHELSRERLGCRLEQLLELLWPLVARVDEGRAGRPVMSCSRTFCRVTQHSSCFQSSLSSTTWPWPSMAWTGASC